MYQDEYIEETGQPEKLIWLDYLVLSNPEGVMKVLADYGYTGYLAPANSDEMLDACMDLLEKYGDKAVIDLLKSNNLYLLIAETIENDGNKQPFKNASGDVTAKIDKEVLVKLAKNVLIVIGAMFIANKFLGYIKE
jgi:hypothetical protein